jgi:hypothetical protein
MTWKTIKKFWLYRRFFQKKSIELNSQKKNFIKFDKNFIDDRNKIEREQSVLFYDDPDFSSSFYDYEF